MQRIGCQRILLPHLCIGIFVLLAGSPSAVDAGDWPQVLGPQRNGNAVGETLPNAWPEGGPPLVWKYAVGSGFAGPVVAGERVVVFHRVGDSERIEALSAKSGKQLWKTDFAASYRGTINPDDGPRCVPAVAGDFVYVFGAAGDAYCVSLADGTKRWSRSLFEDYNAPEGYFGAGSSPIVIGKAVLFNVGGREKNSGIVALDRHSGKTLWTSFDGQASYSSPTTIDLDGKSHAVFVTRLNAIVLDPLSGKVVAETPFGQRGPTVNAANPLVIGDNIFLTASYGIGARLVKPTDGKLKELWKSDDVLSSQYNTPVERNGFVYGIHGREDIGLASLRCIDVARGKVKWSEDEFGVAHLILAGDKLLIVRINGEIMLASASPDKFQLLGKHQAFTGTTRALPALSGGKLFARDDDELKCIAVGKP